MSGEDGAVFFPAHYGLTLHRGDGRLLGLGVLRAGCGLPDWINAEASESSGCTLNQWEEETTGAGRTKKNTFQIAHSTRNTETDTLKKGNKQGMEEGEDGALSDGQNLGTGWGNIKKEGRTCGWGEAGVKDTLRRDNSSQQQNYRQTHGQRSEETLNFTFEVLVLDSSVGTLCRFLKKWEKIYVRHFTSIMYKIEQYKISISFLYISYIFIFCSPYQHLRQCLLWLYIIM